MSDNETDILSVIENDDFYKSFLQNQPKNTLQQALTITEQVKKLGEGIELLNRELQKQVLNNYGDLLQQAHHATKLENLLNVMNMHVQNLFANVERLKTQINGPYNALETHTKVLKRLHLASHILRQVNRIQQLSKRLSNTNDPIQKASILQELEQLAGDPELTDIDTVTAELRNIRLQQQKIVKLATSSLNQGIANENIAQTTTALQIFINLGTVKAALKNLMDVNLGECRESLKSAFRVSGAVANTSSRSKAAPGKVTLTSSQGFRNRVWTDLEKAFSEEIYKQCKQIKFLQLTLSDLNVQNIETDITSQFWSKLGEQIMEEIGSSSSAIQQMLKEDYPKLLKCHWDMIKKLNYERFAFDRAILSTCENAYLSGSLTNLLEPTQQMFSNESNVPSHDQIDSLIRIITSELSLALVEETLSNKVAKNVSKCIRLFSVKTEQQLSTGPDAAQVIGGNANLGQQLNTQLANTMYYLQTQMQRVLSNMKDSLSKSSVDTINESLCSLESLTSSIIQPLVDSINSVIETIIVTIHLETDWTRLQIPPNRTSIPCSLYMRELTQFITRVHHTYLATFDNKEILSLKCSEIAVRCIELFVRHTSLLRPISPGGRFKLQSDYSQLEHALKILCPYFADLGRPFRLLKSMATLVTLSPNEIISSQVSNSSVPHSTVLLMLFSFAGPELASPHQNTGWSLTKLSSWLDEHPSESDRLDLIAGALQRYVTVIRQRNSVNFDPVYPIMSDFLEKAMTNKE